MNSSWMRAQDRKRNFVAAASTASLYALAFAAALLIGSLSPVSLASVPGMVIVDLGGAAGPAGETPQGLETAPDRPNGALPGAAPLPAAATGNPSFAAPVAAATVPAAVPPAAVPAAPVFEAPSARTSAAPAATAMPAQTTAQESAPAPEPPPTARATNAATPAPPAKVAPKEASRTRR